MGVQPRFTDAPGDYGMHACLFSLRRTRPTRSRSIFLTCGQDAPVTVHGRRNSETCFRNQRQLVFEARKSSLEPVPLSSASKDLWATKTLGPCRWLLPCCEAEAAGRETAPFISLALHRGFTVDGNRKSWGGSQNIRIILFCSTFLEGNSKKRKGRR